ncbi:hypothetical protein PFHG_05596 [Plasmodium falciparum HB3]|uniref:Uncharacterized protein n=1 Tax=Plasmodium falciparum (isolate HB3) TaxID=137071 RepID=A0A0L7KLX3_PLAFX|nr:hypothetical protein PFHG_05596 [Plasmodium falciparum HB3]
MIYRQNFHPIDIYLILVVNTEANGTFTLKEIVEQIVVTPIIIVILLPLPKVNMKNWISMIYMFLVVLNIKH